MSAGALFAHSLADKNAHGLPVVLLHGFGGHHGIWRGVREALGDDVASIAYDLPGHACSLGAKADMTPKRAAAAILADLGARGISRAHMVGHSMGGAIATLVALSSPDMVASLTLLAPGGYGDSISEPRLKSFAEAISADELRQAFARMCAPDVVVGDEIVEELVAVRAREGQREALMELCATIARDGRQGMIPREMVARLAMPVTMIWGGRDPVLSPTHADGLPGHFRLIRLDGAGHMLPEEATQAVAQAIRERL